MTDQIKMNLGNNKELVLTAEIINIVEPLMKEFGKNTKITDNDEITGYRIDDEDKNKKRYIRTKLSKSKENFGNYAEAVIEEVIDGKVIKTLDIKNKVIDGMLNKNYLKGVLVSNKNVTSGETFLGQVFTCNFGNDRRTPRLIVKRITSSLELSKVNTSWNLISCESQDRMYVVDKDTEVTIF